MPVEQSGKHRLVCAAEWRALCVDMIRFPTAVITLTASSILLITGISAGRADMIGENCLGAEVAVGLFTRSVPGDDPLPARTRSARPTDQKSSHDVEFTAGIRAIKPNYSPSNDRKPLAKATAYVF